MKKNTSVSVVLTVIVYIIAVAFLLPFAVLIMASFKQESDVFNPLVLPDFSYLENYRLVFSSPTLLSSFFNSVVVCVVTLTLIILFASMAGYTISRYKEKIFRMTFFIFAFALVIPMQANMVLLYRLGTSMHLINTLVYLVLLYVAGNVSYSSMIYSGFTKSVPREIEEAALIDGCGTLSMFFRIVFPLLKPATGTIIVIQVLWYWNDYQGPLIYLPGGTIKTLMLEVSQFKTFIQNTSFLTNHWAPISALCVVASLPIVIFFIFTQKHMLKGLTAGAVKG